MTNPATDLRITALSANDVAIALALQDHVLVSLPPAQRYFIVPKTAEQIAHYLQHEQVYGLSIDGQHAAQLIARHHVDGFEHERNITATRNTTPYVLLQGALVDPEFRGRRLLQELLTDISNSLPSTRLLARIVPHNIGSLIGFFGAGFAISAAAYDPDDERRVFYMENAAATQPFAEDTLHILPDDFDQAVHATTRGYCGIGFNRDTGSIIFRKRV